MTILPGRRCSGATAKEPRDIELDAAALAALHVDTFVLLVEDHELIACGVPTFSTVLADHGIPVTRYPIIDHRTPHDRSSAPRPLSRPPHSGRSFPHPATSLPSTIWCGKSKSGLARARPSPCPVMAAWAGRAPSPRAY
jgi:hypothetical protein